MPDAFTIDELMALSQLAGYSKAEIGQMILERERARVVLGDDEGDTT